jgi:hypothetical protein
VKCPAGGCTVTCSGNATCSVTCEMGADCTLSCQGTTKDCKAPATCSC